MLTRQSFNNLSNPEKYAILEDNGVYLDLYRIDGPFKIALFALSWFYCEVWLDQANDQLFKAVAFSSYAKLDLYIQNIDISEVIKKAC